MKMFIHGEWIDRNEKIEVLNPFDKSVVDTVPQASSDDIAAAVAGAIRGAEIMRNMPAYDRFTILRKAAELPRHHRVPSHRWEVAAAEVGVVLK